MSALLEVQGLTVRYGHVSALEDVSLRVDEGGAVALLGANGAGKTTMLRAIGRLLRFHGGEITEGHVILDGQPLRKQTPAELVEAGIAQCLEGRRIFSDLTVQENLRLGAFTHRARTAFADRYDEMMDIFPRLKERQQSSGALLSGGEQQMLAIARALMSRPRLLLLDEPSLGLAPLAVAEISRVLQDIQATGTALLLVDQTTTLPAATTDTAYLLETGRIRRGGSTSELLSDGSVLASYLGIEGQAPR